MVILERVTRAMAKAAREAASARQAAANNVSKNTSNASNEQSKPGDKGTSSKRKRSGSPPEESSKAAKKSKAGEAGRSDDVDQWLGEIIGTPQESPKLGGNAKRGRRKTVKGNPKGKERQRSGPAGAESSKVFERGESPAEWQYRKWPWDIEERSQERSAKVVKPKQRLPPAVEEEFPDESEPDSDGSDGGDEEASLLENRLVMKWIDDNHVVNEGAVRIPPANPPTEVHDSPRLTWCFHRKCAAPLPPPKSLWERGDGSGEPTTARSTSAPTAEESPSACTAPDPFPTTGSAGGCDTTPTA